MNYRDLLDTLFEIDKEAMKLASKHPDDIGDKCSHENLEKFNDHYSRIYKLAEQLTRKKETND